MFTRSGKLLTALCATLFAGAAHADTEVGVSYSLKVTTFYQYGRASDMIAGSSAIRTGHGRNPETTAPTSQP